MNLINSLGIPSSQVPIGNLVWVDAVNGNDDLAARGRLTIPFRTLTIAKERAKTGDTIMVLPGTYDEKNLLKDGVNWHFFNGAIVNYTGSGNGSIFDTSSSYGADEAVECSITGFGVFDNDGTGSSNYAIDCSSSGSQLILQAINIAGVDGAIKMDDSSGSLHVEALRTIASANLFAVDCQAGQLTIKAHDIFSSGSYAFNINGGNLDVHAHKIYSTVGSAIVVNGGSGELVFHAYEISSAASGPTVQYSAPYNPWLSIYNARIKNSYNNATGYAVLITSGGSDKVRFTNCSFIVTVSADYSLSASAPKNVLLLGGDCLANNNSVNDITFIGGTLNPHSSYS